MKLTVFFTFSISVFSSFTAVWSNKNVTVNLVLVSNTQSPCCIPVSGSPYSSTHAVRLKLSGAHSHGISLPPAMATASVPLVSTPTPTTGSSWPLYPPFHSTVTPVTLIPRVSLTGPEFSSDIAGDGPARTVPPSRRTRTTSQSQNLSQPTEELYDAESIVGHQYEEGILKFQVKWVGYSERHNTWEVLENVRNCIAFREYVNITTELAHLAIVTDELTDIQLLNIPFDKYGEFIARSASERFCPEQYLGRVRATFIRIMQSITTDPSIKKNWSKFFLLPLVLFSPNGQTSRKKSLQRLLTLLEEDNWDSLTTSLLRLKKRPAEVTLTEDQRAKAYQHRIQKLASAGEIGKIMSFITHDKSPVPPSEATVTALQAKHPESSPYQSSVDIADAISNLNPSDSARTAFEIHGDRLRSWIHNKKDFVTPGLDNIRWEHLRQLIGRGGIDRPDEERFAQLLADIVVLLLDVNDVPTEVYDALRDNVLIAIPKGGGDVRPIGMGSTIRKLCSIAFLSHTHKQQNPITKETFNTNHFGHLQYGLQPKGTEQIIHAVKYAMEKSPESDVFLMDADNAFNRISRPKGLEEAFRHTPQIIPFLRQIYGKKSNGWFFGLDTLKLITSCAGFHQGDVLATWLFCMVIHPLLREAITLVGNQGLLKFYCDDGNIVCPHDHMLNTIQYLDAEGTPLGYIIKRNKGTYLLGKCDSAEIAAQRKQHLIDRFGFQPDVIRIHPDNGGPPELYGARILGSYCGAPEFIDSALSQLQSELTNEANAIKGVEDNQIKFLLLRWCFSQKITHLLRTVPLRLCRNFVNHFTQLKRDILSEIIGSPIDDKAWTIAQLAPSDSGLGLMDSFRTSHCAYTASFADAFSVLSKLQPTFYENKQLPCYIDFEESTSFLTAIDPSITVDHIFSLVQNTAIKHLQHHLTLALSSASNTRTLDETVTDNRSKIWHRALQDSDAHLWFECAPKTRMHTFSSKAFSKAIRLRLFLPMNESLTGLQCPCKSRRDGRRVDDQGLHWVTGCKLRGVRHSTHDSVTKHISDILRYCGVHTTLEDTGIFGVENRLRSDITARNFPGATTPIAFDIRITSAVPANSHEVSNTLANDPLAPKKALQAAWNEKMTKYGRLAQINNIGFVPIIFDVTGKMHDDSRVIFSKCLQEAARIRNIPFSKLWHFWMSSLHMTLQRSIISGMDKLTAHALQKGTSLGPYIATDHVVDRSSYISG